MSDQPRRATTFAERFRWVLEHYPGPDGQPRSMSSLAKQISVQHPADPVSANHLWALQNGRRSNPSQALCAHLAQALGCSVLLFFDEADLVQEQALEELRVMHEKQERFEAFWNSQQGRIAARMGRLTPAELASIEHIVEALARQSEQEKASPAQDDTAPDPEGE